MFVCISTLFIRIHVGVCVCVCVCVHSSVYVVESIMDIGEVLSLFYVYVPTKPMNAFVRGAGCKNAPLEL